MNLSIMNLSIVYEMIFVRNDCQSVHVRGIRKDIMLSIASSFNYNKSIS